MLVEFLTPVHLLSKPSLIDFYEVSLNRDIMKYQLKFHMYGKLYYCICYRLYMTVMYIPTFRSALCTYLLQALSYVLWLIVNNIDERL